VNVQDQLLAMAGKRIRKQMRGLYPSLRDTRVMEHQPMPDVSVPFALKDVSFANKRARVLAEKSGLTWASFSLSSVGASSAHGYTTADVRCVIEEAE